MIHRFPLGIGSVLFLGLGLGAIGCGRAPTGAPLTAPASVTVSHPVEREVTDYSDFTARVASVESVEVRSHVWGYLDKVNFKEGALVKKGDVLFELDSRPYEASLNQAKAKVAQDEAQLKFDEAEYNRNVAAGTGVTRSDLEKSMAARNVDIANIAADKSVVASRQLDVDYTKVTAPVSGRISRYDVTVGNLILSGDQLGGTLLTTIVSVDPMYAYFDVDELTIQRVQRVARPLTLPSPPGGEGWVGPLTLPSPPGGEGWVRGAGETAWRVSLGLATEEGFPHQGTINFVDNQVSAKTGTMSVRGVFPNKDEALTPGFFARVRVPTSPPHKALLVSERALGNDQGQTILYVVNDKNEVAARPVSLGQLHDGLRVIEDGLKPGDRIVVNGLQKVRVGAVVEPQLVPMPEVRSQKSEVREAGDEP